MPSLSLSARLTCWGLLASSGGCFRSLPAPSELGPTQISVRRAPAEVVRSATEVLTAQHFAITTADALAGTIVATRVQSVEAQDGDITCSAPRDSAAVSGAMSTIAFRLTARATTNGSEVVMTSAVHGVYGQQASVDTPRASNALGCVSTGAVEQRIIEALR